MASVIGPTGSVNKIEVAERTLLETPTPTLIALHGDDTNQLFKNGAQYVVPAGKTFKARAVVVESSTTVAGGSGYFVVGGAGKFFASGSVVGRRRDEYLFHHDFAAASSPSSSYSAGTATQQANVTVIGFEE